MTASITAFNLAFYLSPYVVMALYDLSPRIPPRLKRIATALVNSFFITATAWLSYKLIRCGWVAGDNTYVRAIHIFPVPTYLCFFYAVCYLFGTSTLTRYGFSAYEATLLSMLMNYVNSFYWEVPENVYWQLVRGYHPAIIFTVLGAFPYIWLSKRLKPKWNKRNIVLVLCGWATTTFGVLNFQSGIYTLPPGAMYFLLCRAVCFIILLEVFTHRSDAPRDSL